MPEPPGAEVWGVDRRNYYTKIVQGYLDAMAGLGHATALVDEEALQAFLDRALSPGAVPGPRPAAVLDINFCGATARLLGEIGVAYAGIVWDVWIQSPRTPPRMQHYRPRGLDYAFCFSPAQVPAFLALGVSRAEALPACCDLGTFQPLPLTAAEREAYAGPVAFCATPVEAGPGDAWARTREAAKGSPRALAFLDGCMRAQEEDLFRYRLPELIAARERAEGLHLMAPDMTPGKETYLNELSLHVSRLQRLEVPRVLAPLGVSLWGPESWRAVEGPGIRYRGPADFHRDLPRLINASALNVNVPKCHALDAVNPRVYEVLACGGFLLTVRQARLAETFEDGSELVMFDSRQDLLDKARHYLAHPGERERIARRGMEKVRGRDGFAARAARIAEVLAQDGRLTRRA